MNTITCPKCHKAFKLKQQIEHGKFRCPQCGEVFTAGTIDTPINQATQIKRPATRNVRLYHKVARQRAPKWAVVLAAVCIVGITVLLVFSAYTFNRDTASSPTAKKPKTKLAPKAASSRPAVATVSGVPPKPAAAARRLSPARPKNDPKIATALRRLPDVVPGEARVVIAVQNLHDGPLEKARLTISMKNESGMVLDTQRTLCMYMPPG